MATSNRKLSLRKKLALAALGFLVVALGLRILNGPPQLKLRTIIEPPPEFQGGDAVIRGFSPDGATLVVEHEQTVDAPWTLVLRRVDSGRIEKSLTAADIVEASADRPDRSTNPPGSFHAFSPDGRLLAVGLDEGDTVRVLDTVEWKERASLSQEQTYDCRFFPDSRTLLVESTLGFAVRDTATGRDVLAMTHWSQGGVAKYWISPAGSELTVIELKEVSEAGGSGTWRITSWNTNTWERTRQIERPCPEYGEFGDFEVAPDGQTLAVVGEEGLAEVRELKSGKLVGSVQLPDQDGEYGMYGWSADDRFVVIEGRDQKAWVWDWRNQIARPVKARADTFEGSEAMSADGRRLATLYAKPANIYVWITYLPRSLWAPALRYLGSRSYLKRDTDITVQNLATGATLGQARCEPSPCALALSPDGSCVAVTDGRGRLLLYDVPGTRR
jgi:WD40 repeat protein